MEKRQTLGEKEQEEGRLHRFPEEEPRQYWDGHHWCQKLGDLTDGRTGESSFEDYNIPTKGGKIPFLSDHGKSLLSPTHALGSTDKCTYKKPTLAVSTGLQNHDVIGVIETSSGKTAVLIPLLVWVTTLPRTAKSQTRALIILAPTCGLAQQTEEEEMIKSGKLLAQHACHWWHSREDQGFGFHVDWEVVITTLECLIDVQWSTIWY